MRERKPRAFWALATVAIFFLAWSGGVLAAKIEAVEVEGNEAISAEEVRRAIGVEPGQELEEEDLERALAAARWRLEASGLFKEVAVEARRLSYGRYNIRVRLREEPMGWRFAPLQLAVDSRPAISLAAMGAAHSGRSAVWEVHLRKEEETLLWVTYRPVWLGGPSLAGQAEVRLRAGAGGGGEASLLRLGGVLTQVLNERTAAFLQADLVNFTSPGGSPADTSWGISLAPAIRWLLRGEPSLPEQTVLELGTSFTALAGSTSTGYLKTQVRLRDAQQMRGGVLTTELQAGVLSPSSSAPIGDWFLLGPRDLRGWGEPCQGTSAFLWRAEYSIDLWPQVLAAGFFAEAGNAWSGGETAFNWEDLRADYGAWVRYRSPLRALLTLTAAAAADGSSGRIELGVEYPL